MPANKYGALGATFQIVRLFQGVSLIAIIGMTANFISEMVSNNLTPPNVLVGVISVTCIAVLYCALTFILFIDDILPFLINTAMDGLLLIAVIVVAVVVGKPLSYLNCNVIGDLTGSSSSAYAFATNLGNYLNQEGGTIVYSDFIGASKAVCLEMKAIWGLSIALCILFAFSVFCSVCLWRQKKAGAAAKADS
ncbi:hypothetical protein VTN77DRAFT_6832 [Rasamsonia byssochlamydoides]|uniref:uncharacterized protein n=1 Tax=Rasamsonia byssochlamydoides TaxID=89139 RepID=UPI00374444EE